MSLLLVPTDGETLPPLNHDDDYYVVRVYPSGVKRTVVERKDNILSRDEALQHEKACNQAMLDELKRWLNLGAFERSSKKYASTLSMRVGSLNGKSSTASASSPPVWWYEGLRTCRQLS